ncbi:phage protein [Campylobacter mucosalis]|uniref:phage protein n=1 Tax=Campylobacter mucosalis TaxID=202 RepID=UPI0014705FDE|nr:hypothetical protein [Campylobacter mucosalis]
MKQFGRSYTLEIGNKTKSVIIENLQISFSIEKTITDEPNNAKIEIYNLNVNNRNALTKKEFNKVTLKVGYGDDNRLIFAGDINKAYTTRQDLDFITTLECGDGQSDYTNAKIYTSLKAGVKDSDIVNMCLKEMSSKKGGVELPKDKALPRCKVLAGNIRDYLKKVANNNNADWHILDGNLNILPKDKVLSLNEGFVLEQTTGLINTPEITDEGVKLTCLLNPKINIGSLVRVKSILSEYDGDYKVQKLTHNGDFLGDTWQTEIIATNGKYEKINR